MKYYNNLWVFLRILNFHVAKKKKKKYDVRRIQTVKNILKIKRYIKVYKWQQQVETKNWIDYVFVFIN